jgi:subtilisin family serine protease
MGTRSLLWRRRRVGAVAVACALTVTTATANAAAYAQTPSSPIVPAGGTAVPDSYLVAFKSTVDRADVVTRAGSLAARFGGQIARTYEHAVRGFEISMSESAARRLAADPSVAVVEENAIFRVSDTQTPVAAWGLDRIDQRSVARDNRFHFATTATDVRAYVIDTGIRLGHREFGRRAISGIDTVDGGSADDLHGHGTHVAGTLGGATYGVAKGVTLVAVRVLGADGFGSLAQVVAGVDWVTADHQPGQMAVANMSLGGPPSEILDTAVANSIADGITYGVAAGNSGASACGQSPARVPTAITVGATTITDARASFSNVGPCVTVFAPGEAILSADRADDTSTQVLSGTSMASPHVAGVAALLLSQLGPLYSPRSIRDLIVAAATPGVVANPGTGSPNKLVFVGLTILPVADVATVVGRSFRGQLSVVNAIPPYVWSVTGLPPGVSSNSTGLITGSPTAAGQFRVSYTVRDAVGRTANGAFGWAVLPLTQRFVGTGTGSRPPAALTMAEADARQQATEAGYGSCTVIGRTVEPNEEFGTWDATVTVNCHLLD